MIGEFQGEYRPLSNFWYNTVYLPDDQFMYPTVEHAYQAAKTDDMTRRIIISTAKTPSEAKRLGNSKETILRPNWNTDRRKVMLYLLRIKFEYNDMRELLLSTGTQKLVEGNEWHDNYYGICSCQSCTQERITNKELGKNWLGRLLMLLRLEIQIMKGIE